jgi:hypothetical protein
MSNVERLVECHSVSNHADETVWARLWIGEEMLVDCFDHSISILEEEDA